MLLLFYTQTHTYKYIYMLRLLCNKHPNTSRHTHTHTHNNGFCCSCTHVSHQNGDGGLLLLRRLCASPSSAWLLHQDAWHRQGLPHTPNLRRHQPHGLRGQLVPDRYQRQVPVQGPTRLRLRPRQVRAKGPLPFTPNPLLRPQQCPLHPPPRWCG